MTDIHGCCGLGNAAFDVGENVGFRRHRFTASFANLAVYYGIVLSYCRIQYCGFTVKCSFTVLRAYAVFSIKVKYCFTFLYGLSVTYLNTVLPRYAFLLLYGILR